VGWVPQDVALFPHLSALDNVAFGLGGRRGRAAARRWLERLDAGALAARRPGALSGGEAQRVALARALAVEPRVLLLDEPLAAVDATARPMLRRALRTHLAAYDGTTLLVTHDPVDAVTLADRVVVLEGGRVVQNATAAEVARAPRSPWVARLLGTNAYRGRLGADGVDLDDGGRLVAADAAEAGGPGAEVVAVVPPEAVSLHLEPVAGSPRNSWRVRIDELAPLGSRVRVHATGEPPIVAEVLATTVAALHLHEGMTLWATVKATEVTVVPL
jgi:molybdate transport system permease protein